MEPTAFAAFAEFLKATGPYGLVAVLGWAFWRVNEKEGPRAEGPALQKIPS